MYLRVIYGWLFLTTMLDGLLHNQVDKDVKLSEYAVEVEKLAKSVAPITPAVPSPVVVGVATQPAAVAVPGSDCPCQQVCLAAG